MTDEEWNVDVGRAFGLRKKQPDEAIAQLRRLSRRSLSSERKLAGSIHAAQALGLAATILSATGRHRAAAAEFRKAAALHEGRLRHHGYGLGSSLASAALELFRCGEDAAATRTAKRALRLFGEFPDPTPIHEELIRRLREHLNKAGPRRARRKRAG